MSDVYENCPAFENDKFLLRFSQLDDAEDLVSVYSDKNALPFFNSDNCHGDNFYYPNEDRMRQAIKFWLSSYSSKWFVRWTIIDKVIPYSTAYGDAGTAAIYWVNRSQIYWGITSYTKGLMTFAGDVTTNRGGFYLLGDIEFDGSASGNIMGVTTKRGTNTATLSGFMIDAKGVSFTAPDVSSSLTY